MNVWLKTAVISLVAMAWSFVMTGIVTKVSNSKKGALFAAVFVVSIQTLAMALVIFVWKL